MISILFGLGLALVIVHNPALGELFQPAWGYLLLIITMFVGTARKIKGIPDIITKSPPFIFLPLILVILMVMTNTEGNIRFINGPTLSYTPDILLLFLPFLFLYVKANPKALSVPFAIVTIIATIGIVFTAFTTGLKSGGWFTVENYDAIVPLLFLGTLLAPASWRWWMSGVSVIGLFFSGSEIGFLAFALLFVILLLRRDWAGKDELPVHQLPIMTLIVCLVIASPLGITEKLWVHNEIQGALGERLQAGLQALNGGSFSDLDFLISGNRLTQTWHIRPLTLLGYGLTIDNLNHATPHNQGLILIDQIGILGVLAWLLTTIAWGIKYKNYYILGLLAVVGMFDHFFWTFGFLWWWALVGLDEQGYLFKNENH